MRGKLNDFISWHVLHQLDNNLLERYWLTTSINDDFDLSIGKQKIKTFGWHRRLTSSSTSPVRSSILNANPLTDKLAVDLVYKQFGTWSMTLVKDYYDPASSWSSAATA